MSGLCCFSGLLGLSVLLAVASVQATPPLPTTLGRATAAAPLLPDTVMVPAGCYTRGSPDTEFGRQPHETPELVCLPSFAIGRFEVTFADYDRFATLTQRPLPYDNGWGRGRRPVVNVSAADAAAYTDWLSVQTGTRWRLPTEAEWEYAARAGSIGPFQYGETITPSQANYNGSYAYTTGAQRTLTRSADDDVQEKSLLRAQTLEVGQFTPNAWGLFDLHGNVAEWTCNRYSEPGATSCAPTKNRDPRTVRGGSWHSLPDQVRLAARMPRTPDTRSAEIGFRLVREVAAQRPPDRLPGLVAGRLP